jgi:hypothetical protein
VVEALAPWVPEDFAVFAVPDLASRMAALRARLSPRLEALGVLLAPRVSELVGGAVYAHVARHARRTVNPPPATWVALGPSPRGYKAFPHLAVAADARGLSFALTLKPEAAEARRRLGDLLARGELPRRVRTLDDLWAFEHPEDPGGTPARSLDPAWAARLRGPRGAICLGRRRDLAGEAPIPGEEVVDLALATFAVLAPLYRDLL